MGTTQCNISNIENGLVSPTFTMLSKINEALNVPASAIHFFTLDEKSFPPDKQVFYQKVKGPMLAMLLQAYDLDMSDF